MPVRNFQRWGEVVYRRKQFHSDLRMPAHDLPFFIEERPGLEKDLIRKGNLTDIMQDRAAANMDQIGFPNSQAGSEFHGDVSDTQGMFLGLLIPQIQCMR